jgi:hypothetical protein
MQKGRKVCEEGYELCCNGKGKCKCCPITDPYCCPGARKQMQKGNEYDDYDNSIDYEDYSYSDNPNGGGSNPNRRAYDEVKVVCKRRKWKLTVWDFLISFVSFLFLVFLIGIVSKAVACNVVQKAEERNMVLEQQGQKMAAGGRHGMMDSI